MESGRFFSTGQEKTASDLGATETWVFPKVVHLRLRDHSLLKFAPGARQVPTSLIDAEKEYLKRNGATPVVPPNPMDKARDIEFEKLHPGSFGQYAESATSGKPVEASDKQASSEAESASGEAQGAEGSQGQADGSEGSKEESSSDKKVSKKK